MLSYFQFGPHVRIKAFLFLLSEASWTLHGKESTFIAADLLFADQYTNGVSNRLPGSEA